MSTRRARIKAVASLPVRRRNADPKGTTVPKQVDEVSTSERDQNLAKSPCLNSDTHVASIKEPATTTKADEISASIEGQLPSAPSHSIVLSNFTEDRKRTSLDPNRSVILTPSNKKDFSPKCVEHSLNTTSSTLVRRNSNIQSEIPSSNCEPVSYNEANTSLSFHHELYSSISTKTLDGPQKNKDECPRSLPELPNVSSGVSESNLPTIYTNLGSDARRADTGGEPEVESSVAAVDGIVPLARAQSRAVDLLKSEIISESAEVLFDPIVPLPSLGKLRPKLRPAPRLALPRRNSVQGSASESEDELKRGLASASAVSDSTVAGVARPRHHSQSSLSTHHSQLPPVREPGRTRNDSTCSVLSHAAPPSPLKDKHLSSRWRRGGGGGGVGADGPRHLAALRRRQRARGAAVQRDQLTMYDLIFYNPSTNPIVESEEAKLARLESEARAERREAGSGAEDDPPAAQEDAPGEEGGGEAEAASAPVPQIKLGPNGEVVIDEQSLVIERTEGRAQRLSATVEREWGGGGGGRYSRAPRTKQWPDAETVIERTEGRAQRLSATVVREWGGGGGGRYSRAPRTKQWPDAETVRFYRALTAVGTDFSLMMSLFPDRSRRDLKTKFKKEERLNGAQIDRALTAHGSFNVEALAEEFASERRDALEAKSRHAEELRDQVRLEREQVKRARQIGVRVGKGGKAVVSILPTERHGSRVLSANDFIAESLRNSPQRKRPSRPQPAAPPPAAVAAAASSSSEPLAPPSPPALTKYMTTAQAYELPPNVNPMAVAGNVAPGSLVCLTIPDPGDCTKKMLQTYVSGGAGKLTPVNLPPAMLASVMEYMKCGGGGSPVAGMLHSQLSSPGSAAAGSGPAPSPQAKRVRHNSYTIATL